MELEAERRLVERLKQGDESAFDSPSLAAADDTGPCRVRGRPGAGLRAAPQV